MKTEDKLKTKITNTVRRVFNGENEFSYDAGKTWSTSHAGWKAENRHSDQPENVITLNDLDKLIERMEG